MQSNDRKNSLIESIQKYTADPLITDFANKKIALNGCNGWHFSDAKYNEYLGDAPVIIENLINEKAEQFGIKFVNGPSDTCDYMILCRKDARTEELTCEKLENGLIACEKFRAAGKKATAIIWEDEFYKWLLADYCSTKNFSAIKLTDADSIDKKYFSSCFEDEMPSVEEHCSRSYFCFPEFPNNEQLGNNMDADMWNEKGYGMGTSIHAYTRFVIIDDINSTEAVRAYQELELLRGKPQNEKPYAISVDTFYELLNSFRSW